MARSGGAVFSGRLTVVSDRGHWDRIYGRGTSDDKSSWFQQHPDRSLAMIASTGVGAQASIIDVGGGLSPLTAALLAIGDYRLWLLDVSAVALSTARERLGAKADHVRFVHADVTRANLPSAEFDVWHDRAVFHFLTEPSDRQRYVSQALSAVKPGGYLLLATFASDGPSECSGLPVMRYDAASLAAFFASGATLSAVESEQHRTPYGETQSFLYCLMRRLDNERLGRAATKPPLPA